LVNYPSLSSSQQQSLPELIKVTAVPVMYDDSTNRLWHCETVDGPMMLKVCDSHNVNTSLFWQGMKHLFGIDLPTQLEKFDQLYSDISTFSSLMIPGYIASQSAIKSEQSPAFILARLLIGRMLESNGVNDEMVRSLAKHISDLHQHQRLTSGAVYSEGIEANQWPKYLKDSLLVLTEHYTDIIPEALLTDVLNMLDECTVDNFTLIMPDLRWDQFLQQDGQLTALVDLDAIVYGPRELELVLLEFLLDEQQAVIFIEQYQQSHDLPDLSTVRKPYRLLLFMMNVLGEKNVDAWMQAPTRF